MYLYHVIIFSCILIIFKFPSFVQTFIDYFFSLCGIYSTKNWRNYTNLRINYFWLYSNLISFVVYIQIHQIYIQTFLDSEPVLSPSLLFIVFMKSFRVNSFGNILNSFSSLICFASVSKYIVFHVLKFLL